VPFRIIIVGHKATIRLTPRLEKIRTGSRGGGRQRTLYRTHRFLIGLRPLSPWKADLLTRPVLGEPTGTKEKLQGNAFTPHRMQASVPVREESPRCNIKQVVQVVLWVTRPVGASKCSGGGAAVPLGEESSPLGWSTESAVLDCLDIALQPPCSFNAPATSLKLNPFKDIFVGRRKKADNAGRPFYMHRYPDQGGVTNPSMIRLGLGFRSPKISRNDLSWSLKISDSPLIGRIKVHSLSGPELKTAVQTACSSQRSA